MREVGAEAKPVISRQNITPPDLAQKAQPVLPDNLANPNLAPAATGHGGGQVRKLLDGGQTLR